MDRFSKILPALVMDLSDEQLKWKPASGNWSILEVVCHLADEEVEDFRRRVRLTLDDPSQDWPPIDPEGVVIERKYNEQNLGEVLERFLKARSDSLKWLRSLENPNWEKANEHPQCGLLRAGDVMLSWAAHDQMHLRQITKRLFEMNLRDGQPYSSEYGGEWKA